MPKSAQITSNILMVRPANFGFNIQTAENNAFQNSEGSENVNAIREKAIEEFDGMVHILREKGINVLVAEDSETPVKPDAVFPNNWVTFHHNGKVILYPMNAPNRRLERSKDILSQVETHFLKKDLLDLTASEDNEMFLEGTGSMIMDRENRLVYACLSPRTHPKLLQEFCRWAEYEKVEFTAVDQNGQQIYHTNVMMALGEDFVVICMESVTNPEEKNYLKNIFEKTQKKVVEITFDQMNAFAGNMLQVKNSEGESFLVLSEQAYQSLAPSQIESLNALTHLLPVPIYTIEKYGGGSARCMMAEIFLPAK